MEERRFVRGGSGLLVPDRRLILPVAGAAAPTEEGNSTLVGNVGANSVPWPTHQTDDVGVLAVETANEPVSGISGWTQLTGEPSTGTPGVTTAERLELYWRVATSSSEANVSLPDVGNHTAAYIFIVRGADPSAPFDALSDWTLDLDGSNGVDAAAVTTTGADRLLVLVGSSAADRASDRVSANHADWTKEYSFGTTAGNGGCLAHFTAPAASAATYGAWTSAITWVDALPTVTRVLAFKAPAAAPAPQFVASKVLLDAVSRRSRW